MKLSYPNMIFAVREWGRKSGDNIIAQNAENILVFFIWFIGLPMNLDVIFVSMKPSASINQ
jgi:hypothetical protein